MQRLMQVLVASLAVLIARASLAPEDQLAKEMTHDLEVNFNKIAPFGKISTSTGPNQMGILDGVRGA